MKMTPVTAMNRYPKIKGKKAHRLVSERALGHELPVNVVVHHHRGNREIHDKNLVICENQAYHMLLERRTRAFYACGDPDALLCVHCKAYDHQVNLCVYVMKSGNTKSSIIAQHSTCHNDHCRKLYARRHQVGTTIAV